MAIGPVKKDFIVFNLKEISIFYLESEEIFTYNFVCSKKKSKLFSNQAQVQHYIIFRVSRNKFFARITLQGFFLLSAKQKIVSNWVLPCRLLPPLSSRWVLSIRLLFIEVQLPREFLNIHEQWSCKEVAHTNSKYTQTGQPANKEVKNTKEAKRTRLFKQPYFLGS